MAALYQIKIKGQLDPRFSAWYDDFAITHTAQGDTLLTGTIPDQAALHGVFVRCRDMGVTILSVNSLDSKRGNPMNWIHAESSLVIDARAADLYAVVSDYHIGHLAIVPKQYFSDLVVEKGGKGAGTVVRGVVTVMGSKTPFHHVVSEPEPGRVLMETDLDTQQYTTFTFEPLNNGTQTRVTIASEFPPNGGFRGFMERLMIPPVARKMYRQELRQLAAYVQSKSLRPAVVNG